MKLFIQRASMAALVATLFFARSAQAQPEEGLPAPGERLTTSLGAPKAPKDGFLGRRPLLKDLSPADQKLLASLILEYTTANKSAVVKTHENTMMDPKLHAVHQAPYTLLFSWHRTYIEGLESFLTSKGQGKFVPLPKWVPSDPIPLCFGVDSKGKKIIKVFDPKQDWTQFLHSKLGVFKEEIRQGSKDTLPNKLILADTLVVPHNNTHNTIAGKMASMSSPSAPIFWCYHAFIDDIAWDFEHMPISKDPPKLTAGQETTTIGGEVVYDAARDRVTIKSPAGEFEVVNEPMKGILKDLAGRTVYVQARLLGGKATVESVTGLTGMDSPLNVRDAKGQVVGTVGTMAEVRITGQKGSRFEIETDAGKGFIVKSGVEIGAATPSETPGVNGAMDMEHHHHN